VHLDGELHYRIASFSRLAPFLVSLASDTDLWMFVASGGGLTAGRNDADGSLFPYLTVDRLHDAHHHTGPLTLIRIEHARDAFVVWEPFAEAAAENPRIERNLYKNIIGSRLVFEEINHELDLTYRYSWSACDEFGWIRSSMLENRGASPIRATVLDGLRNVLPHGAPPSLYQQSSNLVDAYKKTEVDPETGLGIFSLTAGITDRAEALEVLTANTVWCHGLAGSRIHLSIDTVAAFRHGRVVAADNVLNGARGNYFVTSGVELDAQSSTRWHLVADAGRDHVQVAGLRRVLLEQNDLDARIETGLRQTRENLLRNVGSADGLQLSGRPESTAHHFANVLFNNMRGGVLAHNYDVPIADFADFLGVRNRDVSRRCRALLAEMRSSIPVQELRHTARRTGDVDFERLCYEYLPLHFGRRHGDPSRPWNRFSIRTRNGSSERVLHYEGNWRDIFQNWEALCTAFPDILPNIIAKFVNASTVDGFNPYRITRDGVDWETVTPDDPWSNIGYWGDHQIVYLLKLLEAKHHHDPAWIGETLGAETFSYVEIPYRIKPYADILHDPKATIIFDTAWAARIENRVDNLGTDGKLVTGARGAVYHVNLLEKLLVPALAKLSNLIPDAGIWMNTQRPEWNDANNALGGGGTSVVTLCYLRRYLVFLADVLDSLPSLSLPVTAEVVAWFDRVAFILENERTVLDAKRFAGEDRKRIQDALGEAFSDYRETVYSSGFTGKTDLPTGKVAGLCRNALEYLDWGIRANRREDGLYHAYNLLEYSADGTAIAVVHLQEMLEGQVAVLSSGLPNPEEALRILEQLFASALYRPDQRSFMLYPERDLPGFLARNVIPDDSAQAIPLVRDLLAVDDRSLLARDDDGICRFRGSLRSARDVAAVLDDLAEHEAWTSNVTQDRDAVLELFEDVFRHSSYTGRSGVMYGYEGLGCIYWHMVAKLLLAVQEVVLRARRDAKPVAVQEALMRMYYDIRSGLGYEKSVVEYGAFPTDPYSHTPAGGGAKQPGMTGQVKEEILTRRGELGILVEAGAVAFQPVLLRSLDFLAQPADFRYYDVAGEVQTITLAAGSLAFTVYQVPVVYGLVDGETSIHLTFSDGTTAEHRGDRLDTALSAELFTRSGKISRIHVGIPETVVGRT